MKALPLILVLLGFVLFIFIGNSCDKKTVGKVLDKVVSTEPNIQKICLEGFVYYYDNQPYAGGIAPKLAADGRPVPCDCHTVKNPPDVPVN